MSRQVIGRKARIGWICLVLPWVAGWSIAAGCRLRHHHEVLPMAKHLARRAAMQAAKDGVQETLEVSELEVLKEIRDVLVSQRTGPAGEGRDQEPGRGHDE